MELYAGTSGFSYPAWKGVFYPAELPADRWLAHYATQLGGVEINNTFYRMPKRSVLEGWAAQTPEGFRFAVKASQRITHQKRLKEAGDETRYLLGVVGALGAKLGALLFQLPPNLKCDLERFDAFAELLPEGTPAAFEFRHPSWRDEAVLARLRARGFAWVVSDTDEEPQAELRTTAPFAYLRLRRERYEPADLAAWAARIAAAPVERALAFFKHEDAGVGPRLAAELRDLVERTGARRPVRVAAPSKREREAG
jgi:uncharacterized protein YecE (DUF72 family)